MTLKFNKILAAIFAAIFAVSVALGIYFLLPNSTAAYADETDTIANHDYAADHSGAAGVSWTDLNNNASATLSGGYYYLSDDLSCSTTFSSNITVSGTVYLCLNGNILTGTGNDSVITVNSGATFYLCDCQEDEVTNIVTVYTGSSSTSQKTFYSGVITGGNATYGGGVRVNSSATFTMYGGTIAGNYGVSGGGVRVYGSNSTTTTFTMYGGTIAGNTVTAGSGGGVYVYLGTFTMNGGTIAGNFATYGGDVQLNGYTFTMNGGYIDDIHRYYGTITIYGGYLSEEGYNSVNSYIAKGYTAVDISSLGGADIDENYVEDFPYGVYSNESAVVIYSKINALNSEIAEVQAELEAAIEAVNGAIENANATDLAEALKALIAAYEAADVLIRSDYAAADSGLEASISSLESALTNAQTTLQSAINALQTAVAELQTEMAANTADIDSLTSELNEVTSQLNTVSVVVWVLLAVVILMLAGGAAYVVLSLKKRR